MRPPPVIIRRAICDPLWVPLALALALVFLIVAAAGLLTAPLSRMRRPVRLSLFAALYLVIDVGLVVSCAALWLRYPTPRSRASDRWPTAHEGLLRRALSVLIAASRPLLGFTIELEEPPDTAFLAGRPLLVLARHGGPGDSLALVHLLLSRYQRRPCIVLKETLQWDPGLDVLLGRLPSCFLPGDPAGGNLAERVAELASGVRDNDAILLFPEGGNWTPRRYHRALARLRRQPDRRLSVDAAASPHVLPPRPAGALACLEARPDLKIVVVAHTGLEDLVSPADVWRALPVTSRPMVVRWWHEPAQALPAGADDRYQWLRIQWAIVDAWIDARKARAEPAEQDAPAALPALHERPFAG